jgi:hypothetical protein
VAGEEVDLMPGEEREGVTRGLDGDILEQLAGAMPAALDEMTDGRHMALLAHRPGARGGGAMRLPRHLDPGWLGPEQMKPRLQRMGHRKARGRSDGRVGAGDGIRPVALEIGHGLFVVVERGCRRSGHRQASHIRESHGVLELVCGAERPARRGLRPVIPAAEAPLSAGGV